MIKRKRKKSSRWSRNYFRSGAGAEINTASCQVLNKYGIGTGTYSYNKKKFLIIKKYKERFHKFRIRIQDCEENDLDFKKMVPTPPP